MNEFIDKYSTLGIPYPNPETMCSGHCEGIGYYPHHTCNRYLFIDEPTEEEAIEQLRWEKLHRKEMWRTLGLHYFTCDGWHFIKCPICNGSGLTKKANQ